MNYFYTYVLKLSDDDLYIGSTDDLRKRIRDHSAGRVISTKNKRPLTLVYFEGCLSKKLAKNREIQLKTGFGRGYIKKRIKPR